MENNYPTKHDTWRAIFTQPSHKFMWEQQENQTGNIKAIFQDTKINLKLFFIV